MRLEDVRRFAMSLPETTEQPHFDMGSFRVRGKIFATHTPDGGHLHVFVDEHETHACVTEDPSAFEELWWGRRLSGVRVNLRRARAQRVRELLEESWRSRAPKRAVTAFDIGRHA